MKYTSRSGSRLLVELMIYLGLTIPQLMPNGVQMVLDILLAAKEAKVDLFIDDLIHLCVAKENHKDHRCFTFTSQPKYKIIQEIKNAHQNWKERYFFVSISP